MLLPESRSEGMMASEGGDIPAGRLGAAAEAQDGEADTTRDASENTIKTPAQFPLWVTPVFMSTRRRGMCSAAHTP